jgi:hypothetical protein
VTLHTQKPDRFSVRRSWPADEHGQLFPGVPEPSFAWLTANQIATMIGGMVRVPTAVMLDPTRR